MTGIKSYAGPCLNFDRLLQPSNVLENFSEKAIGKVFLVIPYGCRVFSGLAIFNCNWIFDIVLDNLQGNLTYQTFAKIFSSTLWKDQFQVRPYEDFSFFW